MKLTVTIEVETHAWLLPGEQRDAEDELGRVLVAATQAWLDAYHPLTWSLTTAKSGAKASR